MNVLDIVREWMSRRDAMILAYKVNGVRRDMRFAQEMNDSGAKLLHELTHNGTWTVDELAALHEITGTLPFLQSQKGKR